MSTLFQYLLDHQTVLVALIAGTVSLVVGIITALVTPRVAKRRTTIDIDLALQRAAVDEKLTQLRGDIDSRLAEQKARLENRIEFAAGIIARSLLVDPRYQQRSFDRIRHSIRGFEDDELRKILVGIGAWAVQLADGSEGWELPEGTRAEQM